MRDSGANNDALKCLQLGLAAVDFRHTEMVAWLSAESAYALAGFGMKTEALRALNTAREFSPTDPFDDASWDYLAWGVHERLGQIDKAAEFATSAKRKWQLEGCSARDSVEADIALATLHVQTGSSDGQAMAHAAIRKVAQLSSVRARCVKLPPLVVALSERGNQTELVRLGTQVINT
jgi:hypothetical protein